MEKRHTIFIRVLLSLAVLQQSVSDKFFADRLLLKLENFLDNYLKNNFSEEGSVSQYKKDHLSDISILLELIEELKHLKKAPLTPLLVSQNRLLRYKLELLKTFSEKKVTENKIVKIKKSISIQKPDKLAASSNTEQIYKFVQSRPRVRAKEVIDQFSALSERTVKRGLRELTQQGLVKKEGAHKAMYYSAV